MPVAGFHVAEQWQTPQIIERLDPNVHKLIGLAVRDQGLIVATRDQGVVFTDAAGKRTARPAIARGARVPAAGPTAATASRVRLESASIAARQGRRSSPEDASL